MKYLESKKLKELMTQTLIKKGVNADSVHHIVSSLIQTSLRGVDSHGINLFPHYRRAADSGRINKNPKIKITKTASSTATMDADHAFGHHAGAVAIDYATKQAKKTGLFSINVKNSTHFGAAAYFAFRATKNDCIGIAFTNADALVKAYGSKAAFFGTNPICFAAPLEHEEPFCLDMATSLVSWNKILNYQQDNKLLPGNWAYDNDGKSITESDKAKTLNPIGDYKGYGLGMMIDILCGILAQSPVGKDILPMYSSPIEARRNISHFFMVIDISKFISIDLFKKNLQDIIYRIRNLPPIKDNEEVMVAGDPEKKYFKERSEKGIPINESIFKEFIKISDKFNEAVIQ